ncbi:MAG: 5'-deoxyadenosine deaminase [Ignavibacteria bacterium]|nr:5'-deoxyadenosine deaminase [Ignavibacteria bacterium]
MKVISPSYIITMNQNFDILKGYSVLVSENKILQIEKSEKLEAIAKEKGYEIFFAPNQILIPGFVQTHIHLCQTLFRGLADDLELLDWLQLKIMPFEFAHNKESMKYSALLGISELIRCGTTTILDMGSLNHSDVIFEQLQISGLRAFHGKAMMDINTLYPKLSEPTQSALKSSEELAKAFHNTSNGRIKYAFAPRFILSCSDELLKETNELLKHYPGTLFHTHASENRTELENVRKRCGKDNIECFEELEILNEKSCIAHCIWLNENEIQLMKKRNARVLHCPSSNLKLASGIANIPRYLKEGISVSLGADGAPCNNFLDIFVEMRLASIIQKPLHGPKSMSAKQVFELATIGGAKALHLENEIGSIEIGKKADLVLIELNQIHNSMHLNEENLYSTIVFTCNYSNVRSVMIDGNWVFRNYEFTTINLDEVISKSQEELNKLLLRVK